MLFTPKLTLGRATMMPRPYGAQVRRAIGCEAPGAGLHACAMNAPVPSRFLLHAQELRAPRVPGGGGTVAAACATGSLLDHPPS